MKVTGILLAAGASRRMGRDKLIISLDGRTVLRRSAEALLNAGVTDIIIAVSDATRQEAEALCAQYGLRTVNGGETRGDSVYNALRAADCDIALIHDGARCLVSEEIIRDSIRVRRRVRQRHCSHTRPGYHVAGGRAGRQKRRNAGPDAPVL